MNIRLILALIVILASAISYAQYGGDKKGHQWPPEVLAKRELRTAALANAQRILDAGHLQEAIVAFQEVVEIDAELDQMTERRTSSVHHRIAEIYVRLNRPDDAIRSYRKTFWWDQERQDLYTQGSAVSVQGLDYALLLAKAGKVVEAKAMYYWELRGMIGDNPAPFPMLVVFEQDVEMTVWEDTPEKLITAIMMLRAGRSLDKEIRMQEVLTREPGSIAAFVHVKVAYSDLSWLSVAHGLARTSDEREWIARYDILAATPKVERADMLLEIQRELGRIQVERREKSVVLQKAKQDMAQMHNRLAD